MVIEWCNHQIIGGTGDTRTENIKYSDYNEKWGDPIFKPISPFDLNTGSV